MRSLLVLLDGDDERCAVRSELAARHAAAHGSHLLGLAPTGRIDLSSAISAAARYVEDADVLHDDAVRAALARVERFRALCLAHGASAVEAEAVDGDRTAVLLHHAHGADLTVIGQADAASASYRDDQRFVETLLMANPRPTLVVPSTGAVRGFGQEVLLAWDGSRGSARAAADALPLLRDAAQVRLRLWRREGDPPEALARQQLQSVERWLRWQQVTVDTAVETTAVPIGEAMLEAAARLGSDLIVMGTYGHARWAERLLGGATRTALARSPLPLLMSH